VINGDLAVIHRQSKHGFQPCKPANPGFKAGERRQAAKELLMPDGINDCGGLVLLFMM
jgi:hypothetical protein